MTTNATTQPNTILYDTLFLNSTVLQQYSLNFYETNETLSNSTTCYYIPRLSTSNSITILDNGTLIPSQAQCTDPVLRLGARGIVGILFGCAFCAVFLWTLSLLQQRITKYRAMPRTRESGWVRLSERKDGVRFDESRVFYAVFGTAILGIATAFVAIDVDREVLPGLAFKLQCVFYALLHPAMLLALFEAVRYWEWKFVEAYARNWVVGLWGNVLTGVFYGFDFVGMLLLLVRNWGVVSRQWYPEQVEVARRAVGDVRFQIGYYMLLVCWFVILARVIVARRRYRKVTRGVLDFEFNGRLISMKTATLLSSLPTISHVVSLYVWRISPYNLHSHLPYYYCWGLLQTLLVLILLDYGERIIVLDLESTFKPHNTRDSTHRRWQSKKPSWWHRSRSRPQVLVDKTNSLSLDAIRHVRGREEGHEETSRWWWQKEDDERDMDGSGGHAEPVSIQVEALSKAQAEQQSQAKVASYSTADSSASLSQPNPRYRSQQKQGPVRSMLDI